MEILLETGRTVAGADWINRIQEAREAAARDVALASLPHNMF